MDVWEKIPKRSRHDLNGSMSHNCLLACSLPSSGCSAMIHPRAARPIKRSFRISSRQDQHAQYSGSTGTAISTHLPPPVIIHDFEDRRLVTHTLSCSWGMHDRMCRNF
jgi:hypothetical protein